MSGHNKWSKIKNKKGAEDAKKSREFSKFARLIALESKKAAGNVNSPGLRAVIDRARGINMPSSNIERAVKKGMEKDAESLEEVIYEAYGPGGSAIIIHGLTDNKNRSSAEMKHLLSLHDGTLAAQGAALWAFTKEGAQWIPQNILSLSQTDTEKLNALVEELESRDDVQGVFTNAE